MSRRVLSARQLEAIDTKKCPTCGQLAGDRCINESGRKMPMPHATRTNKVKEM